MQLVLTKLLSRTVASTSVTHALYAAPSVTHWLWGMKRWKGQGVSDGVLYDRGLGDSAAVYDSLPEHFGL